MNSVMKSNIRVTITSFKFFPHGLRGLFLVSFGLQIKNTQDKC